MGPYMFMSVEARSIVRHSERIKGARSVPEDSSVYVYIYIYIYLYIHTYTYV